MMGIWQSMRITTRSVVRGGRGDTFPAIRCGHHIEAQHVEHGARHFLVDRIVLDHQRAAA